MAAKGPASALMADKPLDSSANMVALLQEIFRVQQRQVELQEAQLQLFQRQQAKQVEVHQAQPNSAQQKQEKQICRAEAELVTHSPSKSNVSDEPTRYDDSFMEELGAKWVVPVVPDCDIWHPVSSFQQSHQGSEF